MTDGFRRAALASRQAARSRPRRDKFASVDHVSLLLICFSKISADFAEEAASRRSGRFHGGASGTVPRAWRRVRRSSRLPIAELDSSSCSIAAGSKRSIMRRSARLHAPPGAHVVLREIAYRLRDRRFGPKKPGLRSRHDGHERVVDRRHELERIDLGRPDHGLRDRALPFSSARLRSSCISPSIISRYSRPNFSISAAGSRAGEVGFIDAHAAQECGAQFRVRLPAPTARAAACRTGSARRRWGRSWRWLRWRWLGRPCGEIPRRRRGASRRRRFRRHPSPPGVEAEGPTRARRHHGRRRRRGRGGFSELDLIGSRSTAARASGAEYRVGSNSGLPPPSSVAASGAGVATGSRLNGSSNACELRSSESAARMRRAPASRTDRAGRRVAAVSALLPSWTKRNLAAETDRCPRRRPLLAGAEGRRPVLRSSPSADRPTPHSRPAAAACRFAGAPGFPRRAGWRHRR